MSLSSQSLCYGTDKANLQYPKINTRNPKTKPKKNQTNPSLVT